MGTTAGYTKIVNDDSGIPKGIEVETVTWDTDENFVSKVTVGYWVISQSAKDAQIAAIAALESDKAALQNQVASLTSDKAALTSQVASLQSQLTGLPAIQAQLDEALALVEEYRPFDPNQIKSSAFYARITKDELFALAVLASTDATAKGILDLLSAYKTNAWQVLLDDAQVVGAMAYLTGLGVLTSGRASQITASASKDEAYE